MKSIFTALKGFAMGAANVVPGVSGGTIALITGIYPQIVDSLSAFTDPAVWKALLHGRFAEFWRRIGGNFLLALGAGIVLSIFSLAKGMTWALANYPVPTWAFFFGMILASAFFMLRDVKGWKASDVLWTVVGAALGLVVCTLTPTETPDAMWFVFVTAALAICTMILPGISGSFILVILGKYDYIMEAVSTLDWPVLAVFAAGCAVGLLAFARLLKMLLGRCGRQTMLVLVGFVLGSLVKVWPWADAEAVEAAGHGLQTGWAAAFCIIGVAVVVLLETLSHNNESKQDRQI